MSESLLQSLTRSLILNPPIHGSGKQTISNEALFKVAEFFSNKDRVFVIPDPYPRAVKDKTLTTRPANYGVNFARYIKNRAFVDAYYKSLEQICAENHITYVRQPEDIVAEEGRVTKHDCGLYQDEFIHVNGNYYKSVLTTLLTKFA
jgi:hypothetical protein